MMQILTGMAVIQKYLSCIIEADQGYVNVFNDGLQVLILGSLLYFCPTILRLYLIET